MTISKIKVMLPHSSYPIYIGQGCLSSFSDYYQRHTTAKQVFILSHQHLDQMYVQPIVKQCKDMGVQTHVIFVEDGETSKSFETLNDVLDQCLSAYPSRSDAVIAIGGGVVTDLGGFVASVLLRGVDLIQIPTSLLGQVDAAIGGKTAVNHARGKNLVGTFYQPKFILIDTLTLQTLPKLQMKAGMAEVIKYGMIWDKSLFNYIAENEPLLSSYDFDTAPDKWTELVLESAKIKADVVGKDEKESDLRAILNFGHTIGHGVEAEYGYGGCTHGEAVAYGMRAETYLSVLLGVGVSSVDYLLNELLDFYGFSNKLTKPLKIDAIYDKMKSDKKKLGNKLRFVLPVSIGDVKVMTVADEDKIKESIGTLL